MWIVAILEAIAGLLGPVIDMIKGALTLWKDEATNVDHTKLANDASAFAANAVNTSDQVHQQITIVKNQLANEHPALSETHAHALAAMAVAVATGPSKPVAS